MTERLIASTPRQDKPVRREGQWFERAVEQMRQQQQAHDFR